MSNILKTRFRLLAGSSAEWSQKGACVLMQGEPGFVIDENRLKIGDGKTPWQELPYVGGIQIVTKNYSIEFPNFGKSDTLYKAEAEHKLYYWNENKYELLSVTAFTASTLEIEQINGGTANG